MEALSRSECTRAPHRPASAQRPPPRSADARRYEYSSRVSRSSRPLSTQDPPFTRKDDMIVEFTSVMQNVLRRATRGFAPRVADAHALRRVIRAVPGECECEMVSGQCRAKLKRASEQQQPHHLAEPLWTSLGLAAYRAVARVAGELVAARIHPRGRTLGSHVCDHLLCKSGDELGQLRVGRIIHTAPAVLAVLDVPVADTV